MINGNKYQNFIVAPDINDSNIVLIPS
jgi:hypothetical protein